MEKHFGIKYAWAAEAHADRGPHRSKWRDAIVEYNWADPAKLSSEIFSDNRIYCGCRSAEEFSAGKERHEAFGIYVDSFDRLQSEEQTFQILPYYADFVLDNNGVWSDTVNRLLTAVAHYNLDGSHQTACRRGAGPLPPTTGEGYNL